MYGFNCVAANDMKIDDFFPEDNGLFGPFAITCERLSPNTNNTIAITTNVGPVGPFEVPSQQFSELSNKVQQLQMTEEQFRETQDQLRQSVAVLSGSFSALRASEKTCPQTSGDAVSCNAKCEATESVISGACGIPAGSTGSSSIQNFGLSPSTNEWHCLWRGTANQGKAVAFCLPKTSH